MSEILMNDEFVAIPINVGKALGDFDEAVFLQFIYRWCLNVEKNKRDHNYKEGFYWTYMTYDEIHEQLPMFSVSKIKRIIKSLRDGGFLKVGNFNRVGFDRTNWYRVDVEALQIFMSEQNKKESPLAQNDPMQKSNLIQPIPKSSSKSSINNTQDTNKNENTDGSKDKKTKTYTTLSSGGFFLKHYADRFKDYFKTDHRAISQDDLIELSHTLNDIIDELGIDRVLYTSIVDYHFKNLSTQNNGHIKAFVGRKNDSPLYRYINELV